MSSTISSPLSLYRTSYPDPFLDVASTRLPKSHKKLIELCLVFATQHPQLTPIIKKLAKYPITSLVVESGSNLASINDKWETTLRDDVNIFEKAEEFGINYMAVGSVFCIVNRPFFRVYKCKGCSREYTSGQIQYFIKNKTIIGHCKICKQEKVFEPRDEYTDNIKDIGIVFLDPMNITIKNIPMTGKKVYYYQPEKEIIAAVKGNKPDYEIIDNTPWVYVDAAIKGQKCRFNQNFLFHAREPGPTMQNSEWGFPILLPALKEAYLHQVYKKADESLANERTVPARFIFPQASANDPLRTISLAKWNSFMEESIRKWRYDKNAIMPVPFPVGTAQVGGETQQYNTLPLRQQTMREIIGATGVPEGFLADSMSWSGGSVQLRMLENAIMGYVRALERFLAFVVKQINIITKWEIPKVTFKQFSKADDVQMLSTIIQLAQMQKISWREVLERLDLNYDDEQDKIMDETIREAVLKIQVAKNEARAMVEGAIGQFNSQNIQQDISGIRGSVDDVDVAVKSRLKDPNKSLQEHEDEITQINQQNEEQQSEGQQAEEDLIKAKANKANAQADFISGRKSSIEAYADKLIQMSETQRIVALNELRRTAPRTAEEVENLLEGMSAADTGNAKATLDEIRSNASTPQALANSIIMLRPEMKGPVLEILQQEDPYLAVKVIKAITGGSSSGSTATNNVDNRNMPEQKPPRRK